MMELQAIPIPIPLEGDKIEIAICVSLKVNLKIQLWSGESRQTITMNIKETRILTGKFRHSLESTNFPDNPWWIQREHPVKSSAKCVASHFTEDTKTKNKNYSSLEWWTESVKWLGDEDEENRKRNKEFNICPLGSDVKLSFLFIILFFLWIFFSYYLQHVGLRLLRMND